MTQVIPTPKSWLVFSDDPQDKEFEAICKTRSQNKLEFFSSSSFFEALKRVWNWQLWNEEIKC